jgi:dTDP-4-dehydrorhamnose 3,5-epimerase
MELINTPLHGCYIIKPSVFEDTRGYFFESFNEAKFNELSGLDVRFVQDTQSYSSYGVLRGLHFQKGEHAQAKLVRVLKGEVLDVAVDLRKGSATYGQSFSVLLNKDNKFQFFIPRGFAHGFVVLSETAEFFYKCDNYYYKGSEGGIIFNDAELAIDWQIPVNKIKVSEKDTLLPTLDAYTEKLNHV